METKRIILNIIYTAILMLIAAGMIFTIMKNKPDKTRSENLTGTEIDNYFNSYVEKRKIVQQLVLVEQRVNEMEVREYSFKLKNKSVSNAVLEIRAPVTYNYYLDFKDDWSFLFVNGVLRIVAPEIKVKEPAIDTRAMKTNIMGGYMILDEAGKMEEFKTEFYGILKTRAASPDYIANIVEDARLSLAIFIDTWVKSELRGLNSQPVNSILIKFKNEEKFPLLGFSVATGKL